MFRLLAFPALVSSTIVYLGAGGCDGGNPACVMPPKSAINTLQVLSLSAEGGLEQLESVPLGGQGAWLTTDPERHCLYAALLDKHMIASFRIDRQEAPVFVSQVNSSGITPVHLSLVPSGNNTALLVANYNAPDTDASGSTVASYLVNEDCSLSFADSVRHGGHAVDPPGSSHTHSITYIGDEMAVACDLGLNLLIIYSVDRTGKLTERTRTSTGPNTGPRHIAKNPFLPVIYVVLEAANTVEEYEILEDDSLLFRQRLSTLPSSHTGYSKAAEILIDGDGTSLFASNRGLSVGSNSVAEYTVAEDGSLSLLDVVGVGCSYPRGMGLSPEGLLLVAGQDSGNLASFTVEVNGTFKATGANVTGLPTPVAIAFPLFEY